MITILVFGLIAAGAEILGGLIMVLRTNWPKRVQELLLALGAGFILALVFLKLIPASIAALGETAALYIMLGFGVIHFFEHTVVGHLHFGEETHTEVMVTKTASFSAFAGLFVHAFFDGFSISAGMQFDFYLGVLVFLAVLLHKFPEGFTIGSIMLAAGHSRRTVTLSVVSIGTATVLGALAVFGVASISREMIGIAFAFSAGAATYVGASDLIPEINKSKNRIPPLVVLGGMLLFYLSESWLKDLIGM